MIDVIDEADPDEPLALMANFWLPHPPYVCPEPYFSMFDPDTFERPESVGKRFWGESPMHLLHLPGHFGSVITDEGWRTLWGVYLGMVRLLDDCMGRVIEALKARGFWDDALVVFTSDHGDMLGSHKMFQKMCMYEESVRVAMMAKPPGGGVTGRRRQLTQHLDLADTICDYAGLAPMATSQGESFRAVIEDESAPGRDEVFSEYNGNSGRSRKGTNVGHRSRHDDPRDLGQGPNGACRVPPDNGKSHPGNLLPQSGPDFPYEPTHPLDVGTIIHGSGKHQRGFIARGGR